MLNNTSATAVDRRHGIGIGSSAAYAPAHVLFTDVGLPEGESPAEDPTGTESAIRSVINSVAEELRARAASASNELSEVLEATATMACDPLILNEIRTLVHNGIGPVNAVARSFDKVIDQLSGLGGYMAERATDLNGVRTQVLRRLMSLPEPQPLVERSILVARDLSTAETASLNLDLVAGIILQEGGPTGHTAIIARQLGIPCIVQVPEATELDPGTPLLVEADSGIVTVHPGTDDLARLERIHAQEINLASDTAPGATSDNHPVALLANIGTLEDAERAAATVAEGVGLLRTEVLFNSRDTAPSYDEQLELYSSVASAFGDRKTVVRTLDIGADKPVPFIDQQVEENPALGMRGYRLNRTSPHLLNSQLEALAAVGTTENPGTQSWVMAPMISTADEARAFAKQAREYGIKKVGVMVEVPSAALQIHNILAEIDFVSIGTNDLSQYTMGADRLHGGLSDLLSPWQPAVLQLIAMVAREGIRTGKPVGVCGESAADPLMALVLTGLGVTSLSMAPSAIPLVKHTIRSHGLKECRELADLAIVACSAAGALEAVKGKARAETE